jgi:phosphotriesterase-related protein
VQLSAITVQGPVPGDELGITLPHEHLVIDFSCRYAPVEGLPELGPQPNLEDRWRLLGRPGAYRANLIGTDVDSAIAECGHFVAAGGRTIVDLTGVGLEPDPAALKRIAEATGLNVIAATGLYIDASLPAWVHDASVDELADRLADDIETGGAEGIRRGAIGEIAIEGPTDTEVKGVRAAARAQARTGAPVFLHVMSGILPATRPYVFGLVDAYVEEGGALDKLVLCHQDASGDDFSYQQAMLDKGLWFAFDNFGFEAVFGFGDTYIQNPTDTQRIQNLAKLVDAGYRDQLLISQDICYQTMKRGWGGWGYAHILESLPGRFASGGIDEDQLMHLMVDNPARLFAFA